MTHQPKAIAAAPGEAGVSPLRAWRKRQMVDDAPNRCRRTMRLIDVERLYGIPRTTWAQWEKLPGDPGSRRPDDEGMRRLFEITNREITPESFYPVDEWKAELTASGG
jgi:hypothetical protein